MASSNTWEFSHTFSLGNGQIILQDESHSLWAYLVEDGRIKSDCLLLTSIDPQEADKMDPLVFRQQKKPPPLPSKYASSLAYRLQLPPVDHWKLHWTSSPAQYLITLEGKAFGLLLEGSKMGYSRGLGQNGPFGLAWPEDPTISQYQWLPEGEEIDWK